MINNTKNVWNVNSNGNFNNNNYSNNNNNGCRPDSFDTPMHNTYLDYVIKTQETRFIPREDEKYTVDGKVAQQSNRNFGFPRPTMQDK